jgi:DNA-binding response OmpR family regulator
MAKFREPPLRPEASPRRVDVGSCPVDLARKGVCTGPTLHVVEPDLEELRFLCDFLSIPGFRVTGSTHPFQALGFVARSHPEVLICDWAGPLRKGREFLDQVRRLSPRTRILRLHARARPALRPVARRPKRGARLLTPRNAVELLRTVEGMFRDDPHNPLG